MRLVLAACLLAATPALAAFLGGTDPETFARAGLEGLDEAGTAALTLSDHDHAADWLTLALEQQNTTTRYQFSADGVYREGSHYWLYNLVNGIPFLWQYRQAGVDLFPAYQPTFEWAVQVRTGRGWLRNAPVLSSC